MSPLVRFLRLLGWMVFGAAGGLAVGIVVVGVCAVGIGNSLDPNGPEWIETLATFSWLPPSLGLIVGILWAVMLWRRGKPLMGSEPRRPDPPTSDTPGRARAGVSVCRRAIQSILWLRRNHLRE